MNTAVSDELVGRNPCTIRGAGIGRTRERPLLETATVLALAEGSARGSAASSSSGASGACAQVCSSA
jgi:hypothetical protein